MQTMYQEKVRELNEYKTMLYVMNNGAEPVERSEGQVEMVRGEARWNGSKDEDYAGHQEGRKK